MEKIYQKWLEDLEFLKDGDKYLKHYNDCDKTLIIDTNGKGYINYRDLGITVGRETITDLDRPENLVELKCIDSLLIKGYNPCHIELEPKWKLGNNNKGGYADPRRSPPRTTSWSSSRSRSPPTASPSSSPESPTCSAC